MARPNLTVLTGLQVSKLEVTGTQVIGVSATTGAGNPLDIRAKREVIISAGVIGTPKLLELSGIGDRDVLDNAGIQTRVASPGVGSNLQDHYVVRLGFRVRGSGTANERSHGLALAREMRRYVVSGTGVLTYSAAIVGAFAQTRFAEPPDVQYVVRPGSFAAGRYGRLDAQAGVPGGGRRTRRADAGHRRSPRNSVSAPT